MIPAEAVEAAAKKLYQAGGLTVWDKEDESTRNYYRRNAKFALEAAAPHMLAAALEDAAGQLDRELSETRQAQEKPWEWLAGIADAEQALRAYAARYTLNTDGEE